MFDTHSGPGPLLNFAGRILYRLWYGHSEIQLKAQSSRSPSYTKTNEKRIKEMIIRNSKNKDHKF